MAGTKEQSRARKRGGTQERILESTLALFNERGPDRITTAEIARTVGINEGNLYYHFRTKESLVLALFERFEADAEAFALRALEDRSEGVQSYGNVLIDWFQLVWSYRFLFRDLLALAGTIPALADPIRAMSVRMRGVVDALLRRMIEDGILVVPAEDIQPLLANMWIVSTYWAVYLGLQEGIEDLGAVHLDWGLDQVTHLFKPYLAEGLEEGLLPLSRRTP